MTQSNPRIDLQPAELQWREGLPVSLQFDDVYYSRENGLAESRHVFIEGNELPRRWSELDSKALFTIFETGFGTGLNFLCAVQLWLELSPSDTTLHFVSVEKYPLSLDAMTRALGHWGELDSLAAELLANYPPTMAGVHRLWLFDSRVCLTLIFDDALSGFDQLLASNHPQWRQSGPEVADAWFLDGFSPAKNPDLWNPDIFQIMACFSHPQTTLATFTVARVVREGLAAVEFKLHKTPGYGRKREMLRGQYAGIKTEAPEPDSYSPPKVLRNSQHPSPWHLSVDRVPGKTVAIIGAGIAGCATAAALRRRNFQVTLYDRHGAPAMEASGNPQGILYPKLSLEDSPLALFGRNALCYSLGFYRNYWQTGLGGNQCGVLALPEAEEAKALFEQIGDRFRLAGSFVRLVQDAELQKIAGIVLNSKIGLYYPTLGWLSPRDVCGWLTADHSIAKNDIGQVAQAQGSDRWQLLDKTGDEVAIVDHVIFANSFHANRFGQCETLPLKPVRGQITSVPSTVSSDRLQTVLCGAGYLAPVDRGCHTLGATYGPNDNGSDIRKGDHISNLSTLAETDPSLPQLLNSEFLAEAELEGRAAVRCTTPDYLPIVGAVAQPKEMRLRFADMAKNAKADIPLPGCFHKGLWINVGHGSRGLTYAPLAAEFLAAQLNGEIYPLGRQLAVALSPARFIIRQLKRNR